MTPGGMTGSAHSARATARAPDGPMTANRAGDAVGAPGARTPWMRTICRLVTAAVSWHSTPCAEPGLVPGAAGDPEACAGAAPAVPAAGARTLPHAVSRNEPSTT